jgi:hypothetical protein
MKAHIVGSLLIAPATLLAQSTRQAAALRVVDAQGVQVVVANARIDYGGMFASDLQMDGIRLQQGDGVVSVKWSTVDTIRVIATDSARPPTLRLEVVLRNGVRRPATLLEQGHMQLIGQTDLGDYVLDLHKIRLIVPMR